MKRLMLLYVSLFFIGFQGFSQSITVKGTVLDENGNPLPQVSVVERGTKNGGQTGEDGKFSIKVSKVPASLVVSFTGYGAQTIKADGKSDISVKLIPTASQTSDDDVVVVGYQTIKRREVLAPVSSVTAAQLKDIPINSPAEALNGRLAGVTATASEGSPDADIKIRVRGGGSITQDNSPLYIIDGVQVESGLSGLVIQDIANIDVLKDAASTAIYGARGANGVVIITTKSGRPGKVRISYNGFVGVKEISKTLPVLNPYDYVLFQLERSRRSSTDSANFAKTYGSYYDTLEVYKDMPMVDWQDEVLGRSAITTTHNLSASGGNKKFTYNAGYTFTNDQGIALNSNFRRHLFNLKTEYKPTKNIKIGVSGRYGDQVVDGAGTSNEAGAAYNRLRQLIKYKPFLWADETLTEVDPDLFDETNANGLALINPIALLNAELKKKKQITTNAGAYFQYNFTKSISFKTSVGVDFQRVRTSFYKDSITSDSRINGGAKPIIELDSSNKFVFSNSNVLTWKINNYKKKHDWTVLVGQEIYNINIKSQEHRFRDLPYAIGFKGATENPTSGVEDIGRGFPRYYEAHSKQLSFFGKLDYTFLDKYLISGILRADGSSKFAPENRWGVFKSASAAWRISSEKWMKNVKWIKDLKLRASYGEAGNNRIPDYLYQTTLRYSSPYGLNDQVTPGLYPDELVNYNLKWETNVSKNLGLDATFLKGRLDFSVDVYKNVGKDLLMNAPITPVLGYSSQTKNIASTQNTGVEIQVNATIMEKKNFRWAVNFNNSWNKNEVLKLAAGIDTLRQNSGWSPSGFEDFMVTVGQPVGLMYGFVTDGFYKSEDFNPGATYGTYVIKPGLPSNKLYNPEPGLLKVKDVNNDGIIDGSDRAVIGNANPTFTGGLNQQFTYKNFDLSIFINWSVGGDVMNANKIEFTNAYTPNANALAVANENRWHTVDNQGNTIRDLNALAEYNKDATLWKPIVSGGNNSFILHSWAIEDGSFLRFNNISLGYNFPVKGIRKIGIRTLRIYGTVNNLAVVSNYSGYDPEVNTRRASPLTPNVDYSAYPRSRSFIFGVNASF